MSKQKFKKILASALILSVQPTQLYVMNVEQLALQDTDEQEFNSIEANNLITQLDAAYKLLGQNYSQDNLIPKA